MSESFAVGSGSLYKHGQIDHRSEVMTTKERKRPIDIRHLDNQTDKHLKKTHINRQKDENRIV